MINITILESIFCTLSELLLCNKLKVCLNGVHAIQKNTFLYHQLIACYFSHKALNVAHNVLPCLNKILSVCKDTDLTEFNHIFQHSYN